MPWQLRFVVFGTVHSILDYEYRKMGEYGKPMDKLSSIRLSLHFECSEG
jgi:hypothetical protein